MTRQEKINKVSRFCAATDCGNCKAEHMCADVGYGTVFFRWSEASETTLDAMLAAIDAADKPATPPASDPVNHPAHYTAGGVECIDAMVSAFGAREVSNYCICNAFKYIFRHERKNGEEDIAKAEWYLAKYRELRYGTLENH